MKFLSLPIVVVLWGLYSLTTPHSALTTYFLIAATVIAGFIFVTGYRRTAAVNNAVLAAATYQTLAPPQQAAVDQQVVSLLARLRTPINGPHIMVHTARWGWYALAMRELGIPPVGELRSWNIVRNPLTAIRHDDPYVQSTVERLKCKGYPVDMSLFMDD